jgi:hypothetical protein
LSQATLASALVHQPVLVQSQKLKLYGVVLGRDKTVGTLHDLSSTGGTIAPLGAVSLRGFLVIPKKVGANQPVEGSVTISNSHGSVIVSLKGTVTVYKGSFQWASGNLTYKIVSGTDAYKGAKGSGPVLYGPGPVFAPHRFLLDFGNYPPPP